MDNNYFRCVVFIICLVIFTGDESLAQTSRHSANTLGINASIGGPALLGSINASLYPQDDFSIEIGLSPIAVFAGGIYHFLRKDKPLSRWNFYSG